MWSSTSIPPPALVGHQAHLSRGLIPPPTVGRQFYAPESAPSSTQPPNRAQQQYVPLQSPGTEMYPPMGSYSYRPEQHTYDAGRREYPTAGETYQPQHSSILPPREFLDTINSLHQRQQYPDDASSRGDPLRHRYPVPSQQQQHESTGEPQQAQRFLGHVSLRYQQQQQQQPVAQYYQQQQLPNNALTSQYSRPVDGEPPRQRPRGELPPVTPTYQQQQPPSLYNTYPATSPANFTAQSCAIESPLSATNEKKNDVAEQFLAYRKNRRIEEMKRGIFFLPQFVPSERRPTSPGGTNTINIDLWNSYWSSFYEAVEAQEENVKAYFRMQEQPRGGAVGAGQGKLNKRRIVIKIPPSSHPAVIADIVLRFALRFGAVENLHTKADECSVQFTTAQSAIGFASFLKSTDRGRLFELPLEDTESHGRPCNCFLVESRGMKEICHQPTTLLLGRQIEVPSAYLDAVFKDLFEARRIDYAAGNFLIEFQSYEAAKYALHSLQHSFCFVFGLSLTWKDYTFPLENVSFHPNTA